MVSHPGYPATFPAAAADSSNPAPCSDTFLQILIPALYLAKVRGASVFPIMAAQITGIVEGHFLGERRLIVFEISAILSVQNCV
jgi:hypothetical protein